MPPLIMIIAAVAPQHAQPVFAQGGIPTFYIISQDASSQQLLQLDSVAGSGANTSVNVINLFRGAAKHGLLATWHVDCTSGRMNIIKAMSFTPSGSTGVRRMRGEVVQAGRTSASRAIYAMACSGEAQLEADRVRYEELPSLIREYWQ